MFWKRKNQVGVRLDFYYSFIHYEKVMRFVRKFIFVLFILFVFSVFSPVLARAENRLILAKDSYVEDYKLPYPGILPDSPLYLLKLVRDYGVGLLITNPIDKAFYNLHLADKRVASVELLMIRSKLPLSAVTLLHSQENFLTVIDLIEKIPAKEKGYIDLVIKSSVAIKRHAFVVQKLEARYISRETEKARQINQKIEERIRKIMGMDRWALQN